MMAPLTAPAVQALLRDSMVAQLATVSARGHPFLTPIWFVVDGGALYMTTGTGTRAARNVAAHPAVTLLFTGEHGSPGERVLRLQGAATSCPGLPPRRVLARIAAKYYLAPGALASELRNAARWRLRLRYYAGIAGGPGHLRVVPTGAELLRRP